MVGMADPLRQGLPDMMRRFRAAGIRPLMITGDQLRTAQTVAERIGLNGEQTMVDAARLPESAAQIADVAERASGFARTNPAMKLEIVRALQQRGHVVAMTGDGINDGPALKIADVGVAMGASGTDFAHAMSDLLLRDDHPAALLPAIEQGRTAFVNVRKPGCPSRSIRSRCCGPTSPPMSGRRLRSASSRPSRAFSSGRRSR